jgi:hypothetical protein
MKKLLISGEGARDLGACNNAQGQCSDADFNRGPMAVWLVRLWESLLHYNPFDIPEAVVFVSKKALSEKTKNAGSRMQRQRGKKQEVETGLYFSNAHQLGLIAKQMASDNGDAVIAVLFRDADGTCSAPGQQWQAKWDSMLNGFRSAEFDFGVPMLPNPKSEAWLLCAGKTAQHSYAALENISGNDDSPNSAKKRWESFRGAPQNAALEADWCISNPQDWLNLQTMPSFDYFYKRFHEVAGTILRNHTA